MKIIINGVTYPAARRIRRGKSVTYIADGLPELTAEGSISAYRDDGFLLCEDKAEDYARQISRAGVLSLTNEPEPVAEGTDAPTWAEMAAAIQEGVESV